MIQACLFFRCATAESRHLVETSRALLSAYGLLVQADALKHPPQSPAPDIG